MAAQLHSRPHAIGLFQNMLRRWEGLLALATCALTVFYTVFVFAGWGSPEQQVLIANILSPIITLIAAGFGLYVAQRGQIDQRTRWAWHLFALAFLANGLGSIAWAIYESVLQVYPSTSWADVGWLAFYPFLLTAVMVFPTAPYRRNDLLTFWLDAGTVLIGGSMLIWYFSFGPRAASAITDPLTLAVTFAYPMGDLVSLFAVTTIALSRIDSRSLLSIRILAGALLVNMLANLGYSSMVYSGSYHTGLWPNALWCLAFGVITFAAGAQITHTTRAAAVQSDHREQPRGSLNLVPYLGISVGFVLLVSVVLANWSSPVSELVLAASGLTLVVIARQVVAIRESVRLLAERNAATQASQLKTEFLANMSHELRTPLNSIINFTRIVSSGMRGPVTPEQVDYLDRVRQSGEHLLGLINDILDLSKIEAGRMELIRESLNLGDLIRSVMTTAAGLTKDKSIVLKQEFDPRVPLIEGDRTRIRQVLLNLISNAAKFTDEGSITVRTELLDGHVAVRVTDTGVGIAREHLPLIFEEFRQIDSASNRRYEGTGLGLSICQRLVELHGGKLWVESTVGVGSTFSFSLQLDPALAKPVPTLPIVMETPMAETGIPVLVIDDDQSAIDIVRNYLSRDGYAVHGVKDSRKVLDAARKLQPSAIILDILMPYKDGWEVLAELKEDAELRDIPVIIYTIVEEKQIGFHLGASAYLMKPIDEQQLRDTVAKLASHEAHILVIDDDPNALIIAEEYLARADGYRVTTALGGHEGLRRIISDSPDLVVLDLMMPEVDGFSVIEQLRENPLTADIPVIVLSAKSLTLQEREHLNARVQQLLSKGEASSDQLFTHVAGLIAQTHPSPSIPVVRS